MKYGKILFIAGILACFAIFALVWRPWQDRCGEGDLVAGAKETLALACEALKRARPDTDMIAAARQTLGLAQEALRGIKDDGREETEIETPGAGVIQGKVEKGDTIVEILESAGEGPARQYARAASRIFNLKSFRAGQPYAVFTDPATGRIRRFEYEVNDKSRLIVEGGEEPQARLEDIEYVTLLESCEGVIDDSLFQAVADIGESPQLALKLVDLFGSEINFIRDIQSGDSFAALVEKRYREGEYRGYGRILAARFKNKGKSWEAWLFRDSAGNLNYYNSKGENLKKTLLMAPLAVTRMTSRFTHSRKHPILGGTRPHLGVDYAAPTGTPVKAVGAGTITKRGWNGGYGNQVIINHGGALESMYAHLSGFAAGLKNGQKVRQGQVIGFVGSTGLSTGPHLDFRLRQKGNFINPAKAINPRGAPVPPQLMAAFKKVVEKERAHLDGLPAPEKYVVDSIVPATVSLPKAASGDGGKQRRVARKTKRTAKEPAVKKAAARDKGKARRGERKKSGRSGKS